MMDLEYGDRVADSWSRGRDAVVKVSREQLRQLAQAARTSAERSAREWETRTREKLAAEILSASRVSLLRLLRRLVGAPVATTDEEAQACAKRAMAQFASWETNWEATDARTLAERWFGAANTLTTFDSFSVPAEEFSELLDWAARQ